MVGALNFGWYYLQPQVAPLCATAQMSHIPPTLPNRATHKCLLNSYTLMHSQAELSITHVGSLVADNPRDSTTSSLSIYMSTIVVVLR